MSFINNFETKQKLVNIENGINSLKNKINIGVDLSEVLNKLTSIEARLERIENELREAIKKPTNI
ncbi:hypothetical protein [Campylobacter sp. RM12651]|uniref:hypothetical protein n=1 Tax=Campylobacter sp. RM12651 TaxID=1660079 RepID=UPI001EFBBEDD|nr:hypothetical protein [Campylobacter sp. RM12651]ULO02905.1 hypothetical protein AVBRAN_0435 [Campylobacter sp. RM12651]